jgi:glycosyltransferase involved in cell wall biosynthesis
LKQEIIDIGIDASHIAVIPNGIELELFNPIKKIDARKTLGISSNDPVGIYVGRLNPEKGADILIKALSHVRTSPFTLLVVGSGPEEGRLKTLAARLNVLQKVFFVGEKNYAEIPLWISAADVLILPSRNEGHPNAVIESMACGVPVVASRVGGVPEIINSPSLGLLVDPENPLDLARAIDESLAKQWDKQLIITAAKRSWDTVAKDILEELSKYVDS